MQRTALWEQSESEYQKLASIQADRSVRATAPLPRRERAVRVARDLGVDLRLNSGGIGAASGLKMAYAGINKGLTALAAPGGRLVVESRERGGSLTTVREALERGIEVMAVPGSVHSRASRDAIARALSHFGS